ncbi:Elongation factor 4 [Clarias magur]|uniref:Elongation factor 4 n=1 Tax=Clarias magur TaxID=1594786 RepID=A0A8J4U7N4_CLAMG|nr:Elongation factor 4 [Clarias magur]
MTSERAGTELSRGSVMDLGQNFRGHYGTWWQHNLLKTRTVYAGTSPGITATNQVVCRCLL